MAGYHLLSERLEAHKAATEAAESLLQEAQKKVSPAREAFLIGLALYQLQAFDDAKEHLGTSYSLSEDDETAARLAVCHWRTGDLQEAERWIKAAIKLNPSGTVETLIAQTKPTYLAIFAQIQLATGRIEQAQNTARSALNNSPDDVAALYVLANTELVSGNPSKSISAIDKAIANSPTDFIRDKLRSEREAASALSNADVDLNPFVTELAAVQRFIL